MAKAGMGSGLVKTAVALVSLGLTIFVADTLGQKEKVRAQSNNSSLTTHFRGYVPLFVLSYFCYIK